MVSFSLVTFLYQRAHQIKKKQQRHCWINSTTQNDDKDFMTLIYYLVASLICVHEYMLLRYKKNSKIIGLAGSSAIL